ncbi:MAG: glycosyltransferase [Elusimicrobia bacterium]|nr:glycosyltransferase [Elusimicrobiota bacterium]
MWLSVLIFVVITLILGWTLFGYFIYLFLIGLFNQKKPPVFPEIWPKISIIVPCYNEAGHILEKVKNLKEIDYPPDLLEIVFVDGGSSDNTLGLLKMEITRDKFFRIDVSPKKGKINQLNHILPETKGDIIVNTDVDGLLNKEAIKWIAAEFAQDPSVSVVGAYCYPDDTLDIEHCYWSAQNKSRFLETFAKTSSIVVAQCYAFRKELLKSFPEDVVADDVYVAFLANSSGLKTIYSNLAKAPEIRTPKNYSDFIPHKFRKSNAYLRESLRFVYKLPDMDNFFKMMFVTKIAQQLFLPLAFFSWLFFAGVLITLFRFDIVIIGTLLLLVLLIITNRIFNWVKLPDGLHKYSLWTIIRVYIITNIIVFSTGLSYPFYRQDSSYKRLENK